jgi:hypothetical protein
MDNAGRAKYLPHMINVPRSIHREQYYLGKVTIGLAITEELKGVPEKYKRHSKVFSEKESQ